MVFWKKKKEQNDVNKPVVNPGLKDAFKKFELKKSETTLQGIIKEIKAATFLVLINSKDLNTQSNGTGKVLFEKGSIIKFLNTFDEHNNPFLPVFTDWKEIDLWLTSRENVAGWMMTADDVFAVVRHGNYKGLVINLCSDKWEMNKDQIDVFIKETKN